jgi:DNA-binding HxlR family transcriptional regulator
MLLGCQTFTEIQRGAPGIPRGLLTQRLAVLEQRGVIERRPLERGPGYRYLPTEAGKDLWDLCVALGE